MLQKTQESSDNEIDRLTRRCKVLEQRLRTLGTGIETNSPLYSRNDSNEAIQAKSPTEETFSSPYSSKSTPSTRTKQEKTNSHPNPSFEDPSNVSLSLLDSLSRELTQDSPNYGAKTISERNARNGPKQEQSGERNSRGRLETLNEDVGEAEREASAQRDPFLVDESQSNSLSSTEKPKQWPQVRSGVSPTRFPSVALEYTRSPSPARRASLDPRGPPPEARDERARVKKEVFEEPQRLTHSQSLVDSDRETEHTPRLPRLQSEPVIEPERELTQPRFQLQQELRMI